MASLSDDAFWEQYGASAAALSEGTMEIDLVVPDEQAAVLAARGLVPDGPVRVRVAPGEFRRT